MSQLEPISLDALDLVTGGTALPRFEPKQRPRCDWPSCMDPIPDGLSPTFPRPPFPDMNRTV